MVNSQSLTWIALLGLILLIIICSIFHVPNIEKDLTEKSLATINAEGFPFKGIRFNGQDAVLTGEVHSENLKASIEKIVSSVHGVRTVHNDLKVIKAEKTKYSILRIKELNNKLFLTGTLPDSSTIQQISNGLKKISWRGNIKTAFEIDTAITDNQNPIAIFNWLTYALPKISNPNILFENGTLVINGNVISSEHHTAIGAEMNKWFADIPFTNNLKILSEKARQVQNSLQDMLALQKIEFLVNSYELTEKSRILLNKVITLVNTNPSTQLEIEGHTDTSGDSMENLKLSQLRAEAVQKYLIAGGISPKRVTTKGYGDKNPITSNTTLEGRIMNRRVEFVVKEIN